MKCVVVTPEKTVVDQDVRFVVAPLYDGEYGIDANHTPVVGRLGAGELRLTTLDGAIERWYVEGGFVETLDNTVTALTHFAIPVDALQLGKCRAELERALAMPAHSDELIAIKEEAVLVARAKVRVAEKQAKSK